MITTVTDCPIHEFLARGVQPEIVFDKKRADRWAVPSHPIRFDGKPPEFVQVVDGDLVKVPLFAYRTANKELHTLAGFAVELGVRAVMAAPNRPTRMHLVLGYPVVELDALGERPPAYRVHLGMAFLTEN